MAMEEVANKNYQEGKPYILEHTGHRHYSEHSIDNKMLASESTVERCWDVQT